MVRYGKSKVLWWELEELVTSNKVISLGLNEMMFEQKPEKMRG